MSISPTLLKIAALAGLPPVPCQPITVELAKSASETWAPVVVGFLQFCGLAWLTWYIFVKGAGQKTAERQANWYHKIVVDHGISVLADFFSDAKETLCSCIEKLPPLTGAATETDYDALVRSTIAGFKHKLELMRDDLSGRLAFFDGDMNTRFLQRADQLEDDVTDWLDAFKRARPFDQRQSLPRLLIDSQNELLGIIKKYEFQTWK